MNTPSFKENQIIKKISTCMSKTFNFYRDESTHLQNEGKPYMMIAFVSSAFNQLHIKSAKLGTYPDVSSFETPFSDCGRMSRTKLQTII